MKILIVIDQFDDANNGTTISAKRFAEGLMNLGHEVYVVSTGKPAKNKYVVKKLPLPIIVSKIIKSQGMTFAVPNKDVLEEAISKVDVVHFYMPFFLSYEALEIAEKLGTPRTAAFHVQPENITYTIGLGKNTKVNDKIYSFFRDKFFNKFKHIHCPSNFIANELKEHGYTAKTYVISNGVGPEFKYRKNEKSPEFKDKFVITMIGRLSNEKRQDLIFEAISKSKYSDKIQLVLAGKGPKYNKYKKLGEKLANEPVISFFPVLIFSSSPKLNFLIRAPEQIATAAAGVDILIIQFSISLNASFTLFTNFGVDAKAWIEKINSNNITKIKLKIIFFIKPPFYKFY